MPALGPADAATAAKLREAVALHNQGRLVEAAAIYERLLAVAPGNADALHLLGLVKLQRGEPQKGMALIRRAIEIDDRVALFHLNFGIACRSAGLTDEAAQSFRRALALRRDDPEALQQLALIERERGDPNAAERLLRQAARRAPPQINALNNLASLLLEQGRYEEAAPVVSRAIAVAPDHPIALLNQGHFMMGAKRFVEAVASLRRAVAVAPREAMARYNLGLALIELDDLDDAVAELREASRLAPDLATVRIALGDALKRLERFDEAIAEFARADALAPGRAEVHAHFGDCHFAMLRFDEALAAFRRSIEIDPDREPVRYNIGATNLVLGRFEPGWQGYAWRHSSGALRAVATRQRLEPHALAGARLTIRRDQGLGDEIFFLRFLPWLRRAGVAGIVYQADAKIASILRRVGELDRVVTAEPDADDGAIVVAVGDLPLVLGMDDGAQIPPPLPLAPDPARLVDLRARLDALGPPPYVGITWRGGTEGARRSLFKEVPLEGLGSTFVGAEGTLLALQRLPRDGELDRLAAAAGREVHDLTALNDDLEGMLALLALLDDYVCVSNTNVHLRAGTGRTSRVLVPCPPEFRWMATGDESPWFPGHRVYRQTAARDWSPALTRLAADLSG